jgi:hypothetical protein
MDYVVVSNIHDEDAEKKLRIVAGPRDRERLRELAGRWMQIAVSEDIKTKKKQWRAIRDLKPIRPMVLFETFSVAGFVTDADLICEDEILRNVEKTFVYGIRQYEEVKDDIVLEEYLRLPWRVIRSDYGVKIVEHHAENSMGYMSNFPIQTPDDLG